MEKVNKKVKIRGEDMEVKREQGELSSSMPIKCMICK